MPETKSGRTKRITALFLVAMLCCTITCYALTESAFASSAVSIMQSLTITETQYGLLLSALAIGQLLTALFFTMFGDWFDRINVACFGIAAMVVADILIFLLPQLAAFVSPYALLFVPYFLCGIGFNLLNIIANAAAPVYFPEKKTVALSIVQTTWSGVAMLSPVIVTMMIKEGVAYSFCLIYLIYGLFSLACLLFLAVIAAKARPLFPHVAPPPARGQRKAGDAFKVLKAPSTWALAVTLFFYIVFNMGMNTWLPTYCATCTGMGMKLAGVSLSVYNVGTFVMRFICPVFLKRIPHNTAFTLSCVLTALTMLAVLVSKNPVLILVLICLCGFFLGMLAICMFSIVQHQFPDSPNSASAVIFLISSAASMITPAFMGRMAEIYSFRLSFTTICASLMTSGALMLFFSRKNIVKRAQG